MAWFGGRLRGVVCTALGLCPLCLLMSSGCREKLEAPKVIPLEGKVTDVDTRHNRITLWYYNEKQGRDVSGTGEVVEETEILINGALATLADIRVGEFARGQVRVEGKGQQERRTALRIIVERPVVDADDPSKMSEPSNADNSGSTIARVVTLYEANPWLNLDPEQDAAAEGLAFKLFLLAADGARGFHCEGTVHVELYRRIRVAEEQSRREKIEGWSYPVGELTRSSEPDGQWGDFYQVRVSWMPHDLRGAELELETKFEDVHGHVFDAAPKRIAVPANVFGE